MKHEPLVTANALAATAGILYTVCRVLVTLFPEGAYIVARLWLHGLILDKAGEWNWTLLEFLLGLISFTIATWLAGYLFATIYNKLLRK